VKWGVPVTTYLVYNRKMIEDSAIDKRTTARLVGSWRVALQRGGDSRVVYGIANDLSRGGLSLRSPESVPNGMECTIHFVLPAPKPGYPQRNISVKAKILYSVFAGGGEFRHGIQFGDFLGEGKIQYFQYLADHGV
jgi:hypothetical protein